jgi:uncharacterized membrane protein YgcG
MANRPAPKKWIDIQVVIATISMASTLVFWNMFAGPDREAAAKRAQEQAASIPPQPTATAEPIAEPIVAIQPTPLGDGKILFGGNAPQTKIIVQTRNRNGGGGGGGGSASGGGGGGVTSTGSS